MLPARTEGALASVVLDPSSLKSGDHRVSRHRNCASRRHRWEAPLGRQYRVAACPYRRVLARLVGFAVYQDRAGAARHPVAPHLGADEPEVFPENGGQHVSRLDRDGVAGSVDRERHRLGGERVGRCSRRHSRHRRGLLYAAPRGLQDTPSQRQGGYAHDGARRHGALEKRAFAYLSFQNLLDRSCRLADLLGRYLVRSACLLPNAFRTFSVSVNVCQQLTVLVNIDVFVEFPVSIRAPLTNETRGLEDN